MKTLAIIIRCHGNVPVHFEYGVDVRQILEPITMSYHDMNIANITMVTLAKVGGQCYGWSNIQEYVNNIIRLKPMLEADGVRNTDDLVQYLYGPKPKIEPIRNLHTLLYERSMPPIITRLNGHTIQKLYTNDVRFPGLGVYCLADNGFTGLEINAIKAELQRLTNQLTSNPSGHIFKSDILRALQPFNINQLYYIDFSCFGYTNINTNLSVPLTDDAVNWLNASMQHYGVLGGKRRKSKSKSKSKSRLRSKSKSKGSRSKK